MMVLWNSKWNKNIPKELKPPKLFKCKKVPWIWSNKQIIACHSPTEKSINNYYNLHDKIQTSSIQGLQFVSKI